MEMNLQLAEKMAHAATLCAAALDIRVSVAICGDDGRIVAFLKMDGTDLLSGHEAMRRAMTAAGAGVASQLAGDCKGPSTSASMEGIGLSRQAGGLPLLSAQGCFGGIGVCGGTSDQAVECASAGLLAV